MPPSQSLGCVHTDFPARIKQLVRCLQTATSDWKKTGSHFPNRHPANLPEQSQPLLCAINFILSLSNSKKICIKTNKSDCGWNHFPGQTHVCSACQVSSQGHVAESNVCFPAVQVVRGTAKETSAKAPWLRCAYVM